MSQFFTPSDEIISRIAGILNAAENFNEIDPRIIRCALFVSGFAYTILTDIQQDELTPDENSDTKKMNAAFKKWLDKQVNLMPAPILCQDIYKAIDTIELVDFKNTKTKSLKSNFE